MATLYIDTGTKSKQEVLRHIESKDESKICLGVEQAVVQQADGISYADVAHSVVRAVSLNRKNKALKKLFFYFIETFPKLDADGNLVQEALVFCNFLRQQIEHPNEFVRGRAISLLSKLNSLEIAELLYKPLKDNLYHSNSYVRRSVYASLGSFYAQYGFEEIPGLLYECLSSEIDSLNMRQLFMTLYSVNPELTKQYLCQCDVQDLPTELLSQVLLFHKDEDFSMHCFLSNDKTVKFQAAVNLVESCLYGETHTRKNGEHSTVDAYVEAIMAIIKDDEFSSLRRPALSLFEDIYRRNKFSFKNYSAEMLGLCSSNDCPLSRAIFDFAFEISEPHEFMQMSNLVLSMFKGTSVLNEQKRRYKILLLESMARLVSIYGMYEEGMLVEVLPYLKDEPPTLQYASFQFVYAISKVSKKKALDLVLSVLRQVKFGKIFRYALRLIKESTSPDDVAAVVDVFDALVTDNALPYKIESSNVTFVAIILAEIISAHREELGRDMVGKAVAIMLKLGFHDVDLCTKSTINSCIRSLVSGRMAEVEDSEAELGGEDVLEPLSFDLIPIRKDPTPFRPRAREEKIEVTQLTSLSDPLYCEANVKSMGRSLLVDVLCINQTGLDLHNILFDFVTSPNLCIKTLVTSFQMLPNSTREQKFTFKIKEAMNGFVMGRISFEYPDETKNFSTSEVNINLGEIRVSVLDFLGPYKIDSALFRSEWTRLVWENVYSLRFHSERSPHEIAKAVTKKLSGFLVNEEASSDFCLANIACMSEQGTGVLINVGVRRAEMVHFEARIRSKDEDLVKSLSTSVGEALRALRKSDGPD